MAHKKPKNAKIRASQVRLPRGFVFLAPVGMEDLKKDTEHDPEAAEEFVALIRQLRLPETPALSVCK